MPRVALCLIAGVASLSAQGLAVPKETLPPVLTPWEAARPRTREANNSAFPPHRVIGNVYYVGTQDYASFLITSDQGHILINPDFEDSVPLIEKSVEQLGFKFRDIKVILISHAHGDHCAGVAKMKEMTAVYGDGRGRASDGKRRRGAWWIPWCEGEPRAARFR